MIIFSSKKLEKAIAENKLESWGKAKYIIVPAVISALIGGTLYLISPLYGERAPMLNTSLQILFNILLALVTYCGIKKCFQTNKDMDEENFLERFVILSLPIFIKFALVLTPILIIYYVIVGTIRESHPELFKRAPILVYGSIPIACYLYYSFLNRSFTRLGTLIKSVHEGSLRRS